MRTKLDALAVHSIGHAAVARDTLSKVLDVQGSLESRREEPSEGSDKTREARHNKNVELIGSPRDRFDSPSALQ
jgi:hypothetical protein